MIPDRLLSLTNDLVAKTKKKKRPVKANLTRMATAKAKATIYGN